VIKLLDRVVLTADIPDEKLKAGDVGTVVYVCKKHKAVEIEFISYDGKTAVVAGAKTSQVRHIAKGELPHARQLATS